MSDQTQTDLFTENKLSSNTEYFIIETAKGLIDWGIGEPQPQLRRAIIDYHNQLVKLIKEYGNG